jgi:hypothetical protein
MRHAFPQPDIASIRKQISKSIESGDLNSAYCDAKLVLRLIEEDDSRSDILADHLYELGLICIALDFFPEASRHLNRAIRLCQERNTGERLFIVKEASDILKNIEPEFGHKFVSNDLMVS